MGKLVRNTYPAGFSTGLLALIFIISFLLSHQIFEVSIHDLDEHRYHYIGMFLAALGVIVMVLIIWEEILFPIKTKEVNGGMVFKNHRTKLISQLLIYSIIPAIFIFIYFEFEVDHFKFFLWSGICIGAPLIEKIFSGIKNYNDFLEMTNEKIDYKNNEKEGSILVKDIKEINLFHDDKNGSKILLKLSSGDVIIDIDEMELDAYYDSIHAYISSHYKKLLKE